MSTARLVAFVTALALAIVSLHAQEKDQSGTADRGDQSARFRSGVELINVTATVSDANGRFVPGLRQDDFVVYEDNNQVEVTHFSAERVPVSLGIALDTSGSMAGERWRPRAARSTGSLRPARSDRRAVPLSVQRRSTLAARMDERSPADTQSARPDDARTAARRCTTRWPRRSRWRSRARIARRRSW